MILFFSFSSDGLWSSVIAEKVEPSLELMTALESPVLAIHTSLSIISMTMAQEPDLSRTVYWFCLMKLSSASLKPSKRAFSGSYGNVG